MVKYWKISPIGDLQIIYSGHLHLHARELTVRAAITAELGRAPVSACGAWFASTRIAHLPAGAPTPVLQWAWRHHSDHRDAPRDSIISVKYRISIRCATSLYSGRCCFGRISLPVLNKDSIHSQTVYFKRRNVTVIEPCYLLSKLTHCLVGAFSCARFQRKTFYCREILMEK